MSAVLEVRHADVTFSIGVASKAKKALNDISLATGGDHSSITAIVGESGSGKTTLIRLLLGFQTPTSGDVAYGGKSLARMTGEERRTFRRDVQAIFQDPFDSFNPFYRVDHPLLAPLKTFKLASSKAEAYSEIEAALRSVGLDPAKTLGKYPHQLSGGQRQRLMIARALLSDPKIILADEPVSMVDASLRSTILGLLYKISTERNISLIYVTHDLTTAYQVADSIVVLNSGNIVEVGATELVVHDPRHAYTQALISAVPTVDFDKPWDLDGTPAQHVRPNADPTVKLVRLEPMRAVAQASTDSRGHATAAEIQMAVAEANAART